jgi:hypothetical protein
MNIKNRVGNEVHARCFGERTLVLQAKPCGFARFKQRDKHFDPALLEAEEVILNRLIVARAQYNGQADRRISFDPEDIVQVFRLRQNVRQFFLE